MLSHLWQRMRHPLTEFSRETLTWCLRVSVILVGVWLAASFSMRMYNAAQTDTPWRNTVARVLCHYALTALVEGRDLPGGLIEFDFERLSALDDPEIEIAARRKCDEIYG